MKSPRGGNVRSWLIVLALSFLLAAATTINVTWTYEGKPVHFLIDEKGSYLLKLCVQNEGTAYVVAEGVGKVASFEAPGCVNVKVYFDPKEGGNVNGLKAYALYVNFESKGVEIDHLAYLRIIKLFHRPIDLLSQLKAVGNEIQGVFAEVLKKNAGKSEKKVNEELLKRLLECFHVKADRAVTYPGGRLNLTFVNSCNSPLNVTVKLDVANFEDVALKTVRVVNETQVSVDVPRVYSLGPIFARGVYVQVLGKEIYYVPVYDFFKFYIAKNLYATYYENGRVVTEVKKDSRVTGCVSVPDLVPTKRIPALEGVVRVKKDLAFRPDQVVEEKAFSVNSLPFEICVNFVAKGDWFLRGYKMEMVARGEKLIPLLPLEPVAVAKGELKVK